MKNFFYALLVVATSVPAAWSQQFAFAKVTATDDAAIASAIPALANQVIAVYTDTAQDGYLNNLFRLQMVAGNYSGAHATLEKLRTQAEASKQGTAIAMLTPDELTVRAKLRQATMGGSFDEAMAVSFRDVFAQLNDREASDAMYWLWGPVQRFRNNVTAAITKSNASIGFADALDLIRNYQLYLEYKSLVPLTDVLMREDDAKRYVIQRDLQVKTKDGATLCVLVVRSVHASGRLPTALNFTIYAGLNAMDKARQAAIHGYAGVVADARGKSCSPDQIKPWEAESLDVYAVIDWISKQPWSDGQIGMYGGSYEGFTQWAALKNIHPALKTIVPYVASNPGMVLPMQNNVFQNANYAWPFYVMNNKFTDESVYADNARWASLNDKWYASGRPYRDIDQIDGTPNTLLQRQLLHPSYDAYWQALMPFQQDYSKIHIPILAITGYFDPGVAATVQFFTQHYKYNRRARHYLVIGPYDHDGAQQARKPLSVNGYAIDPVAQFDTTELTYQWFDYVMRHGRKPLLVRDNINYEVMGANVWRHAPSIPAMSDKFLTLYLTETKDGEHHLLSNNRAITHEPINQTVDFTDRATTNNLYPDGVMLDRVKIVNALSFISKPFDVAVSIDGIIHGLLKAAIDKRDMDFSLALYEVTPSGQYFNLSYYLGRASYAKDMGVRKLLIPGKVESIPFDLMPLLSRHLSKGSRLLLLLTVNKNQYAQINYGTGKDVSDESIEDAAHPLHVLWRNDSYIRIPVKMP